MLNPSNIHGYYAELDGIKRKELSLAELWDQFKESQRQAAEHAEKVGLYKYGSVPSAEQVNKHYENELQKNNENGTSY